MSKFKNVYLNIAYVHREDNRRECYSGNKAIRAFEKKELGEVTIKQPLTYKAPEGMTKREVATLVSYYLERYISNQTRMCRIKERHVSEAVANDIFSIQFVNDGIKEMFQDFGFVCDFPKTKEEQEGVLSLEFYDTSDRGLVNTDIAKNYAQWKDLYKDKAEMSKLFDKYYIDPAKGAEK